MPSRHREAYPHSVIARSPAESGDEAIPVGAVRLPHPSAEGLAMTNGERGTMTLPPVVARLVKPAEAIPVGAPRLPRQALTALSARLAATPFACHCEACPEQNEGTRRSNLGCSSGGRLPRGVYPELCKILRGACPAQFKILLLHGVYPERYEILRCAQNDTERRARNGHICNLCCFLASARA